MTVDIALYILKNNYVYVLIYNLYMFQRQALQGSVRSIDFEPCLMWVWILANCDNAKLVLSNRKSGKTVWENATIIKYQSEAAA